jgi:hypothetical protein
MKVNQFKVIIAGSRSFDDYEKLKSKCLTILRNKMNDPATEVTIISGHAKGADQLGERFAKELNLRCEVFPAEWDKYGKSAGYKRNVQMADVSNALIAFKSAYGKNIGTGHMIDIAKQRKLLIRVIEDEG